MTGPATNMASISTIWKIMGKRTTVVYLLSIAATSVLSGILLDIIYRLGGFEAGILMAHEHGSAAYGYLKDASAVVLLLLLGTGAFRRTTISSGAPAKVDEETEMSTIHIKGMTCSHCAESVAKALRSVPGVVSVKVNLEGGTAEVEGKKLDDKILHKAVEGLGYTVESIERIDGHSA
jgi:copper chaperone CopZ